MNDNIPKPVPATRASLKAGVTTRGLRCRDWLMIAPLIPILVGFGVLIGYAIFVLAAS